MARIPINLSIFILALTGNSMCVHFHNYSHHILTFFNRTVPILATTSDSSPVVTPDSSSWSRGQEINFTCAVEGAETFGWKSSEYIGSGNDALSFSVSHQIGDIRTNGRIDGTYAVLVSKEGSRLESILHVITQFHGTISCVITDPPELTTNVTISIIDGNCNNIKIIMAY